MVSLISRSPEKLPQYPETWHVLIQQLRIWTAPPDEEPFRPILVMCMNLHTGIIQAMNVEQKIPTPKSVKKMLWQAMRKPNPALDQLPHRPTQIQFEEPAMAEALAPDLKKIGVEALSHPRLEGMDDLVRELEEYLREGPEVPGLLTGKGVTPEIASSFFEAAAEFYRAEPWNILSDRHVLAVRVGKERKPRFAIVMGQGGYEYGLAKYQRWKDIEALYGFVDHFLETIPKGGAHSMTYTPVYEFPVDDLEAQEKYGWPVAGPQAYPFPVIFLQSGKVKRPDRAALLWYEAVLRAVPIVVRDYLQPNESGDFRPFRAELVVTTAVGDTSVVVEYPAGTLPAPANRPADLESPFQDEEAFMFDRRAMESSLSIFGTGFQDPALNQAQQIMYEAWEEQNPVRRIMLARQALSISPDCADAYVLLAEEEADTVGRALEYYQKGVEAGERALGKDYFEQDVGYFWGLLETRPYMRAREGLARTLVQLKRYDEAIAHYRDMLRLNPGDNQGIRYSLLNLLTSLGRDDEAWALLNQYDDGMAEWLYTQALLTFRREGPTQKAAAALRRAIKMNPHVPAYLTGRKRIPRQLPPYISLGEDTEAMYYASGYLPIWRKTPGALDWLKQHTNQQKKTKGRKRKR